MKLICYYIYYIIVKQILLGRIQTVKESFSKRTCKMWQKKTTTFLANILTLDNFVLNCKQYLKVKGCDMGMVCAPLHVNIFMDHFENKCIYTFLQGTTLTYLQFIDDIFFILQSEKTYQHL